METKKGNTSLLIIIALVAIIFIILFFQGCFDKKTKVTVPAVSGKTDIKKPEQKPIVIFQDSVVFKYIPIENKKEADYWKSEAIRLGKENDGNLQAFQNANDSLQQLLYSKEIEPKEYLTEWDNDTINAKVFGMKSGTIHSMQLKYTVKERKQEINIPKTVFRLLGGIETGMTKDLSKINFKANLGFQNKSGDILSASFDSDQRIYIGYTKSLFEIKK